MRIDRWHGRRPEGTRGNSVARLAGYRRHSRQLGPPIPKPSHQADVGALVNAAITVALTGETREDRTFGDYASVFGFCRSAVMQEGRLWPAAGFVDTEIRCLTELESWNAEKEVQPRVQA